MADFIPFLSDLAVKVTFAGKTRRILLRKGSKINFDVLDEKIREIFRLEASTTVELTYKDLHQDTIFFSTTEELQDALVHQRLNPLCVQVVESEESGSAPPSNAQREVPAEGSEQQTAADSTAQAIPLEAIVRAVIEPALRLADRYQGRSGVQLRQLQEQILMENPRLNIPDLLAKWFGPQVNPAGQGTQQDKGSPSTPASAAEAIGEATPTEASPVAGVGLQVPGSASQLTARAEKAAGPPVAEPTKEEAEVKSGVSANASGSGDNAAKPAGVEARAAQQVFHTGVQCDVCGVCPIVGPRFASLDQADFDLCKDCKATYPKKEERFNMLEQPRWRPRHWGGCRPRGPHGAFGPMFGGRPFQPAGPWHPPPPPFGVPLPHIPPHVPHCNLGGRPSSGKLDVRFVKDVTIYDGTELAPGAKFTKIWRLRNSGTVPWLPGTQVLHIGADLLAETSSMPLQLGDGVAPTEEVDVAIDMTAPAQAGRYVSYWRLAQHTGQKFGHRFWALIQVVPKDEDSPQVAESAAEAAETATAKADHATAAGSSSSAPPPQLALLEVPTAPRAIAPISVPSVVVPETSAPTPAAVAPPVTTIVPADEKAWSVDELEAAFAKPVVGAGVSGAETVAEPAALEAVVAAPEEVSAQPCEAEKPFLEDRSVVPEREVMMQPLLDVVDVVNVNGPTSLMEVADCEGAGAQGQAVADVPPAVAGAALGEGSEAGMEGWVDLSSTMSAPPSPKGNEMDVEEALTGPVTPQPTEEGVTVVEIPVTVDGAPVPAPLNELPSEGELQLGEEDATEVAEEPAVVEAVPAAAPAIAVADPVVYVNLAPVVAPMVSAAAPPAPVVAPPAPAPVVAPPAADKWVVELMHLEAMGFTDGLLGRELLEVHNGNIAAVVDALIAASEWGQRLDELEDLGFTDRGLNVRLMVAHRGSFKDVVKELVARVKATAAGAAPAV